MLRPFFCAAGSHNKPFGTLAHVCSHQLSGRPISSRLSVRLLSPPLAISIRPSLPQALKLYSLHIHVLFLYLWSFIQLAASITPTFLSRRSLPRGNRPDKFALAETFDSCDEFRHGRAGGREGGTRDGGRELNCLQKLRDSYITAGRPLCAPSLSRPIPIRTLLLM